MEPRVALCRAAATRALLNSGPRGITRAPCRKKSWNRSVDQNNNKCAYLFATSRRARTRANPALPRPRRSAERRLASCLSRDGLRGRVRPRRVGCALLSRHPRRGAREALRARHRPRGLRARARGPRGPRGFDGRRRELAVRLQVDARVVRGDARGRARRRGRRHEGKDKVHFTEFAETASASRDSHARSRILSRTCVRGTSWTTSPPKCDFEADGGGYFRDGFEFLKPAWRPRSWAFLGMARAEVARGRLAHRRLAHRDAGE